MSTERSDARNTKVSEPIAFVVGMNYPGDVISKNHCWRGGSRRNGLELEAQKWKDNLAESVKWLCKEKGIVPTNLDQIHVQVGARFIDRANSIDLQNVLELVCDAVEKGTGVNDKYFTVSTLRPTFEPKIPEIVVYITIHLARVA